MRRQQTIFVLLLLFGAARAGAERSTCVERELSHISAHTALQTIANFEWSGISRDAHADAPEQVLKFECSGTVLIEGASKRYNYLCELHDAAGDKFALQNDGDALDTVQYVRGGGTGKHAERAGPAPEFRGFPMNSDATLANCDPNQKEVTSP